MKKKHIVIVGTNFGGYTGALELKKLAEDTHDITVIANTHKFTFYPSFIWYPFGLRQEKDITFDVRPIYEKNHIQFIETNVTHFDPERSLIYTNSTEPISYDYLLIATGPKVDYDYIPGLREHSYSIVGLPHADRAKEGWQQLMRDPGPVIIGASQGAACFGAAYEFLFNVRYQLAKEHLTKKAPLTYVTAEPFLAHFGINGFGSAQKMCEWMFKFYHIDMRLNSVIKEVKADGVLLESGEFLPSKYTMIMPRFLGVDAVRNTPGLANASGFIEVDEGYQHPKYPNIYAAGIAVAVKAPGQTAVACGVPKTGYPTEIMAKTAVKNILADIEGKPHEEQSFEEMKALCILDTGNMGMMIVGDHMMEPRKHELIIPGPEAHWAKIGFEKYFLASRKRGHV